MTRIITCLFLLALASVPATANLSFVFNSPADNAVTASGYSASGTLDLSLNYQPTPGRNLTVVKNTGPAFISGIFDGVPQGATVPLAFNGVIYNYIADYYGGNGRSLILRWPLTGLAAWGSNQYGQLGNGGLSDQTAPVAVNQRGTMAVSSISSIDAGENHTLALSTDGRIFAWGDNDGGQLGNAGTQRSKVPVAVDRSGALAGKTVVAVSGGGDYSLALDSSGLAYSWGENSFGNLGIGGNNGYYISSSVPVAVDASGVLNGKTLTAIAAGSRHALALSSEGKVYAWGTNGYGALGNNYANDTFSGSSVPVAVDTSGVLAGKTIVAIDADYYTSLALSSDGQVFSWGDNSFKQLGNGGTTNSPVPVAVNASGAMAGKFIIAIATSQNRNLALSSDGKIYTWGTFIASNNGTVQSGVPIEVSTGGVLVGKTLIGISARYSPCTVLASDGKVFVWQQNATSGGLVAVVAGGDLAGRFVSALTEGSSHGVELIDAGPPVILRQPWSRTLAQGQTATFTAKPGNEFPSTVRWQVSPTGPAGVFSDIAGNPSATTGTLSLDNVSPSQNGHAFRAVFSNASGSRTSRPATLTVLGWSATFASADDIPFTGETITASGNLDLQLGFTPAPGSNLTVIRNQGTEFISGAFANVPQGGTVALTYNSVTYNFIADYFGGNGRSLVLHWARTRLMAWGENEFGKLGTGDSSVRLVAAEVEAPTAMLGKITKLAASGGSFSMALTANGRLFTWGNNSYGRLGTNTSTPYQPTEVTATGALAGKTVVDISASSHCLALTSDGRVYAWGLNSDRQLGTGSTDYSVANPVELAPEAFDGQPVVSIRAGMNHSMALTADGRVFSWGSNSSGKTGNGTTTWYTPTPTEVITSENLNGLTIVAIAAGEAHSLALASDGRLFAWGSSGYSSPPNPGFPLRISMTGALAGKTIARIAASGHSLVLTTDGVLIGWGSNYKGQLGTGTTTDSPLPVAINGGALAGKIVSSTACSSTNSAATTTDGKAFTWGGNDAGQLGDGTTSDRTSPVAVATLGGPSGLKAISMAAGGSHTLALVDAGAPRIVSHPSNRTASEGNSVTFTALAADPFGYEMKWQVSTVGPAGPFTDVTGNASAVTSTLVIGNVTAGQDQWAWRAVFSNVSGSSATEPAVLDVVGWSGQLASATGIPNQAEGPVVGGALDLNLNFAPIPGTHLTVLKNTGVAAIEGTFSNIPQGGRITLNHGGTTYEFIANYFGGNGRSLVLQWPWMKVAAAGSNSSFQLGQSGLASSSTPLTLPSGTWSSGRSILAIAAGANHNLAVMSDGRLAAWGRNSSGQLGNGTSSSKAIPVDVVFNGVLAGETVVAAAAGDSHSLALTRSGRVFAWGSNSSGQLGDGSTLSRTEPVEVAGLSGQKIVAIAAGNSHNLALSSQGMVYAWGAGSAGQLGNKSNTLSPVAVPVHAAGVLAGKRVVAIAAGNSHSLALSANGQVFAWGSDTFGALGNNNSSDSNIPNAVDLTSGLAGKNVVGISAGTNFSLARTEDDKLFAWGINSNGQFGSSTPTTSQVPIEVAPAGARIGKTILDLSTGTTHSLAVTTDGQLLTWGSNSSGQLGVGTTASQTAPVAAMTPARSAAGGASHTIAMFAGGSGPEITGSPAGKSVIKAGTGAATVSFSAAALDVLPITVRWQESDSGPAGPFSDIVGNASASTTTLVLADVSPLLTGHAYRAVFTNSVSSSIGTAATLSVATAPGTAHFGSATEIPMSGASPTLIGEVEITLGFAPVPGTDLTLVRNTGSGFLTGSFSNLIQGEEIQLGFEGRNHKFVVDYFGGNGLGLVLHWAETLAAGWGAGSSGQVGAGSNLSTNKTSVAVVATGAMAGQKVVKIAAGSSHNLALAASGRVFAWGSNGSGRLGNGSTTSSNVPIEIDATGELAGKQVVAIAAGDAHSLALTTDGQIAAWGSNTYYMLGNGGTASSSNPVAVMRDGVLAGKTVTAIAAGQYHNIALASDGTLVAWGRNSSGQLGSGSTGVVTTPVAVAGNGALAGKTVVAIAAGGSHSLALTVDGRVYSWGSNLSGQLGSGSSSPTSSSSPAAISGGGLIAGKTVVAISAGASHSLAVTSDGKVYAWGLGSQGQLGTGNNSTSFTPVAVSTTGVLAGKSMVAISAGGSHSLAISSDGLGYAWGLNSNGQLGNNGFSDSSNPVAISTVGAIGSRPLVAISAGGAHSLAFAGKGTAPTVAQSPTSQTVTAGSTVMFTSAADGYPVPTLRWQRSAAGPAGSFTDLSGQTAPAVTLTNVTASQNGYAYRAVFTNLEASSNSVAATLTVQPTMASFLLSRGLAVDAPPLEDSFHTGVPHLLAYAFDLNPAAPDRTKLPTASRVAGRLRISYTRWKNATDLRYTVEADDGLDGWQSGPGITETVSVTSLDNTRETVIEQEILPDPTPSRFLRVRVELDPP